MGFYLGLNLRLLRASCAGFQSADILGVQTWKVSPRAGGHLSEQPLKVSVFHSLRAVSSGPRGPQRGDGGKCRGGERMDLFGKKQ